MFSSLSLYLTNTLISVVKTTWRVAFHSQLLIGQGSCTLLHISVAHFSRKWFKTCRVSPQNIKFQIVACSQKEMWSPEELQK